MEQLFKQHAPDVEVFPKEGNGIPPQIAKNIPVLAPFPSASRPPESSSAKEDDLDVLGQDKYEDESTLTDHFGQMALDAEGQLRYGHPYLCICTDSLTRTHAWNALYIQMDRRLFYHDLDRNFP